MQGLQRFPLSVERATRAMKVPEECEEARNGVDSVECTLDSVECTGVVRQVDNGSNGTRLAVDRYSSQGKIFVGGILWDTTEETFSEHFEKYGEITDSIIMKDKYTRRPRGFGFVTFADPAVVDNVLKDDHVINGRAVEVKRTVPREIMQGKGVSRTKKLFVGGIPPSFTEDELKGYFSSYGNIVEHHIILDHQTGRSRGFGFVTFESEETVEVIISEGTVHELGGKQVEVKKAEPKRGDQGVHTRRYTGGSKSYSDFGIDAIVYGGDVPGIKYGGRALGVFVGCGYGYGGCPTCLYGGYNQRYGSGVGYRFSGPFYGNPVYGGSGYGYGYPGGYGGAYNGGFGYGFLRGWPAQG